jgi:DNA invertase Pin-like site-specific DNA recombinase
MQQFEYPLPDIDKSLRSIAEQAEKLNAVQQFLGEQGLHSARAEKTVSGLYEVRSSADKLARETSLYAITNGYISRIAIARILHYHQATVSRWVNEAVQEQQENPEEQQDQ